jgi:NADH-quinone oxidoreductase subunit N
MWSPDVYEGAPVSSTIFFAVIPKIAMFSVFLRLFQTVFSNFQDVFLLIVIFFSLVSVIVGSFVALKQKKIKRLLAYSSISHVGYMLLAFSANSIEGTQALFFYLIIYMITSLILWSILLSVNTLNNDGRSKTLVDLSFLSATNPLLALTGLLAFFFTCRSAASSRFLCEDVNIFSNNKFFSYFCKYFCNTNKRNLKLLLH